jgi:hypothetical protein
MVYTNINDVSRTHFITISPNYNETKKNIGTQLNIKTWLPREVLTGNNSYQFDQNNSVFYQDNFSNEVFKNRVIFSGKINDDNRRAITLLTQQNLIHNIKFIHKDNDFKNPRILFIKHDYRDDISNNNQYLFNPINNITDLSEININDICLNINNTDADIIGVQSETYKNLKRLNYNINFYKPFLNSDYYKFKFSDFIDLSFTLQNNNVIDFCYNLLQINVNNIGLQNNFASNNLINYDVNNFTQLFNYENINNDISNEDISYVNTLIINNNYDYKDDNILIYNKFDNISTVNLNLNYQINVTSNNIGYNDICINFFVIKGFDNYSKLYGKIYLTNNFTYLNSRVLNYNNNFYSNNTINSYGLDSSMVYLSLGNSITGITQNDLYTKIKLELNSEQVATQTQSSKKYTTINKIYFSNSVNSLNVDRNIIDRHYLLESGYNYNYTNILYNNIIESNKKQFDLNLIDFYHKYNDDFSQNIYNHRFNSLGVLNDEISSNQFDVSYQYENNKFFISSINDISYDNENYKFRFNDTTITASNANSILYNTPLDTLNYDFRFNYNVNFNLDIYLTAKYLYGIHLNDLSFETLNDYNNNLLLNFHKIILTSNFITPGGSDFTNVDCIFIYYDPYDDNTPEQFKYPYNNIEISNNPSIDTLSRAIELLPGAPTSVTNSTFIPARNGSNLSRKKIQGLIGLNNVPALLSIEPYDENVIIGRGFLNQYQIVDDCKSDVQIIKDKLNSQKHISVKNPSLNNLNTNKIPRTTNFANLVRSRKRNQNVSNAVSCETDPSNITNYNTPFMNPMWKRTHRP